MPIYSTANRIPKVLGLFLLGFGRAETHLCKYRTVSFTPEAFAQMGIHHWHTAAIACTGFEIFVNIPEPSGLGHTFFYAISVVPLALAATSVICLRWIKKREQPFKHTGTCGQDGAHHHLMQTVLGISFFFIYYGIGLGLGGNTGPVILWQPAWQYLHYRWCTATGGSGISIMVRWNGYGGNSLTVKGCGLEKQYPHSTHFSRSYPASVYHWFLTKSTCNAAGKQILLLRDKTFFCFKNSMILHIVLLDEHHWTGMLPR